MKKSYIIISSVTVALGVALGAFGAHGLEDIVSENLIETYRTGIFYHLIHSVVLFVISLNSKYDLKIPYYLFLAGIIFFSFSLYLYTITNYKIYAMITPVGGILFLLGWISIILVVLRKK